MRPSAATWRSSDRESRRPSVVVDALLGTGVRGELREPIRSAVELINRARADMVPVLAVDTPTAVDLSSGQPSDPAVRADLTITFHRPEDRPAHAGWERPSPDGSSSPRSGFRRRPIVAEPRDRHPARCSSAAGVERRRRPRAAVATSLLPPEGQAIVFQTPLLIVVLLVGTAAALWRIARPAAAGRMTSAHDDRRRHDLAAPRATRRSTSSSSAAASSAAGRCSTRRRAGCGPRSSSATTSRSGTSSRSSRLIHGGLRYLRAVPHRARPRGPRGAGAPAAARAAPRPPRAAPLPAVRPARACTRAFYEAGMTLYDVLGARRDGGWHRHLSVARDARAEPRSAPSRPPGGARLPRRRRGRRPVRARGRRGRRGRDGATVVTTGDGRGPDRRDGQVVGARVRDGIGGGLIDVRARSRRRCDRRLGRRSVRAAVRRVDPDRAEPRRPPRRPSRPDPERRRADAPGPGQGRLPRPVAGPLADRDDGRAVPRPDRSADAPAPTRSTSCWPRSTGRSTST